MADGISVDPDHLPRGRITARRTVGSLIGAAMLIVSVWLWIPFVIYMANGHEARGVGAGLAALGFVQWGLFGVLFVLSILAGWGPRAWIFRISILVFLTLLTVATTVTITGAQ